jgi:2-polyprenyl-3-methyl-5-hydroxy-6-metoxy-1,4-benzoquinol methylase
MNSDYYNKNADSFYKETVNLNMNELYQEFTRNLSDWAKILDAGCGSGRDTLAFLKMGYQVDAFDASFEMVKLVAKRTGLDVQQKRFEEIESVNHYDGIWCCASLLHVPFLHLPKTMLKLAKALKPGGIWYVSFKHGKKEREKDGRHFTDLNKQSLKQLVSQIKNVNIFKMWITDDARPKRSDKWLNAILKKTE